PGCMAGCVAGTDMAQPAVSKATDSAADGPGRGREGKGRCKKAIVCATNRMGSHPVLAIVVPPSRSLPVNGAFVALVPTPVIGSLRGVHHDLPKENRCFRFFLR